MSTATVQPYYRGDRGVFKILVSELLDIAQPGSSTPTTGSFRTATASARKCRVSFSQSFSSRTSSESGTERHGRTT
jgi:hypothetical protein